MLAYSNLAVVILAAGRGSRLKSQEVPKPLRLLNNRPLISYILTTLNVGEFPRQQIWLVVHFLADQIKAFLGSKYQYIFQKELNGTAGALADALAKIPEEFTEIMVLQSDDSMFYQAETLESFVADFQQQKAVMSLITLQNQSKTLGSLIRDSKGAPTMIWSQNRCEMENLVNKEIVTGVYLFNRPWAQAAIQKLQPDSKGEIGLPYLIEVAYQEKQPATTFNLIDPREWASINTPEELAEAEARLK